MKLDKAFPWVFEWTRCGYECCNLYKKACTWPMPNDLTEENWQCLTNSCFQKLTTLIEAYYKNMGFLSFTKILCSWKLPSHSNFCKSGASLATVLIKMFLMWHKFFPDRFLSYYLFVNLKNSLHKKLITVFNSKDTIYRTYTSA